MYTYYVAYMVDISNVKESISGCFDKTLLSFKSVVSYIIIGNMVKVCECTQDHWCTHRLRPVGCQIETKLSQCLTPSVVDSTAISIGIQAMMTGATHHDIFVIEEC